MDPTSSTVNLATVAAPPSRARDAKAPSRSRPAGRHRSARPSAPTADGFRADIQGLRGIAVLLVVVFHMGIALPGGYVGVDVFFVVSGFVIARLLVDELVTTGGIDLRRFYVRRVRRLLPALAGTTVVTLLASIVLLSPTGDQEWAAMTAAAASLFSANLFLYAREGGYFSPAEETNPFLHTWSLSVEEQFYAVLPAVLLLAWLAGRRLAPRVDGRLVLAGAVGGASALSLLASWYLSHGHSLFGLPGPDRLAFYGSPTRVWEFGAGILLALGLPLVRRVPAGAAAVGGAVSGAVGAAALAFSVLRFDHATVFPGVAALVPVAGTALLIAAGTTSAAVARPLGWRPLAKLGDLSYGWYLWHWPAIVFAKVLWPDDRLAPVLAGVAALGVAVASYRWVEQPIRHRRDLVGRRAVRLATVCIVVPLAVVGVAALGARHQWGLDEAVGLRPQDEALALQHGCVIESEHDVPPWPADDCWFRHPGATGTMLVLGDSHAGSLSDGAVAAGRDLGLDVALWARGSCPLVNRSAPGYDACSTWQSQAVDLVDRLDPTVVVIANRSAAYVHAPGAGSPRGPIGTGGGTATTSAAQALAEWGAGLDEVLSELTARAVPVVLMSPVPEYPSGTFGGPSLLRPRPEPPTMGLDEVHTRRGAVVDVERQVASRHPSVAVFDPVPSLCGERCRAGDDDGRWLYRDNHHLNAIGSARLAVPLAEAVRSVASR